eukprot:4111814-Pyramimonas_sp.AAC.1
MHAYASTNVHAYRYVYVSTHVYRRIHVHTNKHTISAPEAATLGKSNMIRAPDALRRSPALPDAPGAP